MLQKETPEMRKHSRRSNADLLNDRVLSFFEQQVPLLRILTDRGTEFCGPYDEDRYQPF